MEGDSVILRNHFLGVEYRPWESLWPGSPSQNSFFSSCFCHTWDRLGPGLRSHEASKCKDTIKGGKVLHVCTVGTDYEQQDTKRSNPNSHYWGVGSKSNVVSISWHTAPPMGWADHLNQPLVQPLNLPYPHPYIRQLSGADGGLLFVLTPPCCGRGPNKTLPEFLVWPLINFCWLRKPRNLISNSLVSVQARFGH